MDTSKPLNDLDNMSACSSSVSSFKNAQLIAATFGANDQTATNSKFAPMSKTSVTKLYSADTLSSVYDTAQNHNANSDSESNGTVSSRDVTSIEDAYFSDNNNGHNVEIKTDTRKKVKKKIIT